MKITPALLSAAFSFWLLSCGNVDERSSEVQHTIDSLQTPTPPSETPDTARHLQISGFLQSSGLQPDEAKALGIKHNAYQLIADNAYFLEGPDSLAKYVGQCLTLSGQVASGWEEGPEQIDGQYTYNRLLFIVEGVNLQPVSHCFFTDSLSSRPQGRSVTYLGQVERMQRPAPDIAYDYQLRLQKPYRNPNDPLQPGRLVRQLPLTAVRLEILSTIENALRDNNLVRVRGIQYQGYAESEAIWVEAAEELASGEPASKEQAL
ncbi:MAG: hypothetical protein KY428_00810 [Bacteroidetes bacterium]|nr:hypothetical protein [Bacteroidota bacterium]